MNKAQHYIDELKSYYTPTKELLTLLTKESKVANEGANATSSEPNATSSESNATSSEPKVPHYLQEKVNALGKRVPLGTLKSLVVDLCSICPYSSEEIATTLGRSEYHILNRVIRPLLDEKKLFYTIPDMINHPRQEYTTIPKKRSDLDGING